MSCSAELRMIFYNLGARVEAKPVMGTVALSSKAICPTF